MTEDVCVAQFKVVFRSSSVGFKQNFEFFLTAFFVQDGANFNRVDVFLDDSSEDL
jgi:hypothetical protein